MLHIECPVCKSRLSQLFIATLLSKHDVDYYKCSECGLIKTEEPYWLDEAYSEAIADLDVGLVARNMMFVPQVSHLIEKYFDSDGIFLDHAGGYGLFVRMMRDAGYNFFRQDKYCQNIFAKYFDFKSCDIKSGFELITAFEFLEHVVDPVQEIDSLLALTDTVIFSTELQPEKISSSDDWWYFATETGQHITFYTKRTFEYIAALLGTNYYSDGQHLHLFTRKKFDSLKFPKEPEVRSVLCQKINAIMGGLSFKAPVQRRKSLVWPDYRFIKNLINRNDNE